MYLYFDSNGVLKEIINDKSFRQGNVDVNKIYIYVENTEISSLWIKYKNIDGTEAPDTGWYQIDYDDGPTEMQVPYNPRRDLKYFKYYTDYPMYEVPLEGENAEWSALNYAGTVALTMRIDGTDTLGLVVFNVEESVEGNYIASDEYISLAQFNYLLSKFSGIDYNVYDSELNEDSINAVQNKVLYKTLITRNLPSGMHGKEFIEKYGNVALVNYGNLKYLMTVKLRDNNNYDITAKNLENNRYYIANDYSWSSNVYGIFSSQYLSDDSPYVNKLYAHNLYLGKNSDETETYRLRFYSNRRQAITNNDQLFALEEINYHIIKDLKLRTVTGLSSSDANVLSLEVSGAPTSMDVGKSMYIRIASGTQKTCILETFTDTVTEV